MNKNEKLCREWYKEIFLHASNELCNILSDEEFESMAKSIEEGIEEATSPSAFKLQSARDLLSVIFSNMEGSDD